MSLQLTHIPRELWLAHILPVLGRGSLRDVAAVLAVSRWFFHHLHPAVNEQVSNLLRLARAGPFRKICPQDLDRLKKLADEGKDKQAHGGRWDDTTLCLLQDRLDRNCVANFQKRLRYSPPLPLTLVYEGERYSKNVTTTSMERMTLQCMRRVERGSGLTRKMRPFVELWLELERPVNGKEEAASSSSSEGEEEVRVAAGAKTGRRRRAARRLKRQPQQQRLRKSAAPPRCTEKVLVPCLFVAQLHPGDVVHMRINNSDVFS